MHRKHISNSFKEQFTCKVLQQKWMHTHTSFLFQFLPRIYLMLKHFYGYKIWSNLQVGGREKWMNKGCQFLAKQTMTRKLKIQCRYLIQNQYTRAGPSHLHKIYQHGPHIHYIHNRDPHFHRFYLIGDFCVNWFFRKVPLLCIIQGPSVFIKPI